MRNVTPFVLFFSLIASQVPAEPPADIKPYVHSHEPLGSATVNYTFFTVYDASLWTDARPFSLDKPFALELRYHHHFPTSGLVKKTLDEMARIDHVPEAKLKDYGARLRKLWPSVGDGDTITAVNIPRHKTLFYYNGKLTGSIDDPAFSKPFFDVWFSDKTAEPEARKKLLGE